MNNRNTLFVILILGIISTSLLLNQEPSSIKTSNSFKLAQTSPNTITIAIPNTVYSHNPAMSNPGTDQYALASVYLPLVYVTPVNDPTFTQWQAFPALAGWYNHSADYLTWFVNLKSGLKWQDGVELNTSDIKFTIDSVLNQSSNSPLNALFMRMFSGSSWNSTVLATIQAHATQIINSTLLKFQFGQFDPYQINNMAQIIPLPKHQLESIPVSNWSTDPTNTGATPITGDGPYMYMNTSVGNINTYLDAWSGWDASYASKFNDGPFNQVPTITSVILTLVTNATQAINELESGQIDVIDSSFFGISSNFNQITSPAKVVSYYALGVQEMGLNQRSPIWGFNPLDPAVNYAQTQNYCVDLSCSKTSNYIPDKATNTSSWIVAEQANAFTNKSDEWFYNALTSTDRLAIRKAIDYSIDRQGIIDNIMNGHGYLISSRLIPQSGLVNASIVPRPYNLTMALLLLNQTFGYKYSSYNSSITPFDESRPYFRITLMVPNTNVFRAEWAGRIAAALTSIGIDVTIKSMTFVDCLNRVFYFPVQAADNMGGVDFAHGGFDAYFAGWGAGIIPSEYAFYSSKFYAPVSNNYQFLNSSYMDNLMNIESTSTDSVARTQAYNDEQQFVYNQALVSMILQPNQDFVINENLKGFNPFLGYSSNFVNWTLTTPVITTIPPSTVIITQNITQTTVSTSTITTTVGNVTSTVPTTITEAGQNTTVTEHVTILVSATNSTSSSLTTTNGLSTSPFGDVSTIFVAILLSSAYLMLLRKRKRK